jgi:hypothetical protein
MMTTVPVDLDPSTHHDIVQCLCEKLRVNYVFPDIAEQICAGLQKHLEDGEYSDISEGAFLAYALTQHMQEVNHDEHLWVRWHAEPMPEDEGPLHLNPEWQDERRLEAGLDNYGIHRVERLPGNVGYIDIHYLHRPGWGGETAAAAMNFLTHTHALIIDLRSCLGGYPGMVALICSYLFEGEPLHLASIYWRDEDITQQYWTLPYVPGKRFGNKPVYVLTSKATFSGAEMLACILQSRQRATLIGEQTDGGANPGASYRLHPHLEVFIPIGHSIIPRTGTNWEGVGITPNVAAPQEQALNIAHRLALKSIIEGMREPLSGPYSHLLEEAVAALKEIEKA